MLDCSASLAMYTSILKALPGKLDIKRHSPSILYMHVLECVFAYGKRTIISWTGGYEPRHVISNNVAF